MNPQTISNDLCRFFIDGRGHSTSIEPVQKTDAACFMPDMALKNAKEALGLHIWGMEQDNEELPIPSPITSLHLTSNQVPTLVNVFMPAVRERINNRSVNHTVTLPAWLNAVALENNINFSQVLQDALKKQLQVP